MDGRKIFSPITHTHPIAQHGLPKDWTFWRDFDLEYLEFCESMIVLTMDGWEKSKGVQEEIQIMTKMHKPISYLSMEDIRAIQEKHNAQV